MLLRWLLIVASSNNSNYCNYKKLQKWSIFSWLLILFMCDQGANFTTCFYFIFYMCMYVSVHCVCLGRRTTLNTICRDTVHLLWGSISHWPRPHRVSQTAWSASPRGHPGASPSQTWGHSDMPALLAVLHGSWGRTQVSCLQGNSVIYLIQVFTYFSDSNYLLKRSISLHK